jgi:isopropylmalate/homocitrate/citramalate synthase
MIQFNEKELIYDWNKEIPTDPIEKKIEFDDETLRDGLQSPSVTDPSIEQKIELLHLMDELGIDSADIGLPGAAPRFYKDSLHLTREIADAKLKIRPNIAARTVKQDITPAIEITNKTGIPIEVCTFIGSSPIRQYVEEWTLDLMVQRIEEAVTYVVQNGLPNMFVTEDTTRAHPDTLRKIYTTAIECGSKRVCVCDTVGHVTPEGVTALISFIRDVVKDTGEEVKIDWHGHMDRGLGIPNTVAALRAGVDRVHGTALGIGERVGNTPMDLLLVNLKLMGYIDNNLSKLHEYCELVSQYCNVPITANYPVVGSDAFRTGTGVHAAAVIKAQKKGHNWLADRVYSGVPAGEFGLQQKIEIGPMSGQSNIIFWLEQHGIDPDPKLVEKIYDSAKESNTLLKDSQIFSVIKNYQHRKFWLLMRMSKKSG